MRPSVWQAYADALRDAIALSTDWLIDQLLADEANTMAVEKLADRPADSWLTAGGPKTGAGSPPPRQEEEEEIEEEPVVGWAPPADLESEEEEEEEEAPPPPVEEEEEYEEEAPLPEGAPADAPRPPRIVKPKPKKSRLDGFVKRKAPKLKLPPMMMPEVEDIPVVPKNIHGAHRYLATTMQGGPPLYLYVCSLHELTHVLKFASVRLERWTGEQLRMLFSELHSQDGLLYSRRVKPELLERRAPSTDATGRHVEHHQVSPHLLLKRRQLTVQIVSASGDHELVRSLSGDGWERLHTRLKERTSPNLKAKELVVSELCTPEGWVKELGWHSITTTDTTPYPGIECERIHYVVRLSIADLPPPPSRFISRSHARRPRSPLPPEEDIAEPPLSAEPARAATAVPAAVATDAATTLPALSGTFPPPSSRPTRSAVTRGASSSLDRLQMSRQGNRSRCRSPTFQLEPPSTEQGFGTSFTLAPTLSVAPPRSPGIRARPPPTAPSLATSNSPLARPPPTAPPLRQPLTAPPPASTDATIATPLPITPPSPMENLLANPLPPGPNESLRRQQTPPRGPRTHEWQWVSAADLIGGELGGAPSLKKLSSSASAPGLARRRLPLTLSSDPAAGKPPPAAATRKPLPKSFKDAASPTASPMPSATSKELPPVRPPTPPPKRMLAW